MIRHTLFQQTLKRPEHCSICGDYHKLNLKHENILSRCSSVNLKFVNKLIVSFLLMHRTALHYPKSMTTAKVMYFRMSVLSNYHLCINSEQYL